MPVEKLKIVGNLFRRPQAEDRDRHGQRSGQHHANARVVVTGPVAAPLAGHRVGPGQQAPVSQLPARHIFQRDDAGELPRRLQDGRKDIFWRGVQLDVELLPDHRVVEPAGELLPRAHRAHARQCRRRQDPAEMGGDTREPFFPVRIGREGEPVGAAQITGDNFGVGFEKQKARAIIEFHQRAGARKAALGEKHQFSARLQIFRHSFDGVRRIGVHGKGKAVDHQEPMHPTDLRALLGGDNPPLTVEAGRQEQPIEPGDVIGQQHDRSRRGQRRRVMRAEPKQ